MIAEDPLFQDCANNDFHLTWLSPCINRGNNDEASSIDFEGDPRPYMGTIDMGVDEFFDTHSLEADTFRIIANTGGEINFYINAGVENAGRNYLVLGSITGTVPGLPLPGGFVTIPLNWDLFTDIVTQYLNSFMFNNFLGQLDPSGNGDAKFNTLGPLPSVTVGLIVSFAYCLNSPFNFVSTPVNIDIE
jgi:hypothetical protein